MTSPILWSMICTFIMLLSAASADMELSHEASENAKVEAKSDGAGPTEGGERNHINIISVDHSSINTFTENSLHSEGMDGWTGREGESHMLCSGSPVALPFADDWRPVPDRPVYTYSAFFDDRGTVNGPLVRVSALGLQRSHVTVGDMYCQFATVAQRNRSITCLAAYSKIYDSIAHADEYTAHWLECPYPKTLIAKYGYPKKIAIVPTPCKQSSHSLTIKYKKKKRSGFGVCLPSLYKMDDAVGIAEWIILHKLLGYTSIIMYNGRGHVTPKSKIGRILNLYNNGYDKNISVQLVSWNHPHHVTTFYFAQHSVINDCLYRTSMDHTHVTVCDKDEVIFPLKHATIPEFVKSIETKTSGAYMAQHVLVDTTKANEMPKEIRETIRARGIKADALHLTTMKYTTHMSRPHPAEKVRSKTIYNVDRTISADVHFPKSLAGGFHEVLVPPGKAVVYHYRQPGKEEWLRAVPYVNNSRVATLQQQLVTQVAALVKRAGIGV